MKMPNISKRGLLLFLSGALALVVVACGGGSEEKDAAVQEMERAQALGILDKLPVSWAPSAITFNANPGARQNVPVTLTTTKTLTNAKIVFVPDLRSAVTVTPDTIPTLAAGQSATVMLSFAPAATDTRKFIAGIVLLYDKNATTSRPLPVKVTLVAPELINGIAVPPEPPAELNNATLAGFDTNGNGVRDDVERVLTNQFGGTPDYSFAMDYARQYQLNVVSPTPLTRSDALVRVGKELCATEGASETLGNMDMYSVMLTTLPRKRAIRAFNDVLVGYLGSEVPPCVK
jgi:hypothetical protein